MSPLFQANKHFVCIFLIFCTSICYCSSKLSEKKLLIISLDGFGRDFLQQFNIPNIVRLFHAGSHPKILTNQYPTKTLPNHFSIATGLYVENHGVLGSEVYDSDLDKVFNATEAQFFQQKKDIKPLWILNEEQGGVSACLQWAGCGFNYNGVKETYTLPFSPSFQFDVLVDVALRLLNPPNADLRDLESNEANPSEAPLTNGTNGPPMGPPTSAPVDQSLYDTHYSVDAVMHFGVSHNNNKTKKPANLVMMYFSEPDQTGHLHGIHSEQFKEAIEKIDSGVGYLMREIESQGLKDKLDVILMSDHGMIDIPPENILRLGSLKHKDQYRVVGFSPLLQIFPVKGFNMLPIYAEMKKIADEKKNFSVLIPEDLPEELHYRNNTRTASLLLQADPGFVFEDYEDFMKLHPQANASLPFANHGYDWRVSKEMLPILLAVGPSFRENVEVPSASNVDIYPLACSLLGLQAPPMNGSSWALGLMLSQPPALTQAYSYILAFCALLAMLGVLAAVYYRCIRDQNSHQRLRNDPESLISGYVYSGDGALSAEDSVSFSSARLRFTAHPPIIFQYANSSANSPAHMPRPSAIMSSEDELEEEEKLLSRAEEWEV